MNTTKVIAFYRINPGHPVYYVLKITRKLSTFITGKYTTAVRRNWTRWQYNANNKESAISSFGN